MAGRSILPRRSAKRQSHARTRNRKVCNQKLLDFFAPLRLGERLFFHRIAGGDTIQFMFKGLEHTAIASPNPASLAKWYVDHLEFHINFTYAGNYFVKAANGTMLEIIPSEGARGSNLMKDPGIRHLAIISEDFVAAHEQLKKQGVKF